MCDNSPRSTLYKKLRSVIFKIFFLFLIFFLLIPNQCFRPNHFRPWLKKFVFLHRIYCSDFICIDNVQQWHFQLFKLLYVILTPKKFSKI